MPSMRTYFFMPKLCALLLMGCGVLAGCGFQLRGDFDLPPALAQVAITGADRELIAQLSDALQQHGAQVVAASQRVTVIDLPTSRFARTVLTAAASGRASAYAIAYEVVFTVRDGHGAVLQTAPPISLQRVYQYDPGKQLQAEPEMNFLKRDLRRAAVARMLRQFVHL